jgi:pimeloyl-ACP methyl ester carboxylesterase
MKYFFVILAFTFSTPLYSKEKAIVTESIETQTKDGVELQGVRWVNEGQKRILLIHGFSENLNVFRDLAKNLYLQGYDVYAFNSRGHGNDDQRSHVEEEISSFDHLVTQDIPAMIDFIYDGEPIEILGHSLGGSAARYFLNGIRNNGKGLYQSKSQAKINKYLNKVKNLITVGSPTSFQKSDFRFQIWTKLPASVTPFMLKSVMRKYLGEYIFSGLIEMKNIDNPNGIFVDSFSVVSEDLVSDIHRWSEGQFESRNGTLYESQKVLPELNFYQIVGGLDQLVPLEEILNEHEKYNITENPQILVMKDFGHIDLVYGKKSSSLLGSIINEISTHGSLESLKNSRKIKIVPFTRNLSCNNLFI